MEPSKARVYLAEECSLKFTKYIEAELAGNFACEVAKKLQYSTQLTKKVKTLHEEMSATINSLYTHMNQLRDGCQDSSFNSLEKIAAAGILFEMKSNIDKMGNSSQGIENALHGVISNIDNES